MVVQAAITLILIVTVAVLSFSQIACENMNGERTVSGKMPLESRTEDAEKIVDSLVMPPGSLVLETRITSKGDLGVVTKKYSTNDQCEELDAYLNRTLVSSSWTSQGSVKHGLVFVRVDSSFSRGDFKIDFSCDNLRDFRGIRKFYVTCFWQI